MLPLQRRLRPDLGQFSFRMKNLTFSIDYISKLDGEIIMPHTTRVGQLAASESNETNENVGREPLALSEAGGVTVAALLHLIRLMGAEIVFARRDCDPTIFEQAVRVKLNQFSSPTRNKQAIYAGTSFAHTLVEQVLSQIRAQAELKQTLQAVSNKKVEAGNTNSPTAQRKTLN
jgi:hypothetical protein